jgi:IS1 family transposase
VPRRICLYYYGKREQQHQQNQSVFHFSSLWFNDQPEYRLCFSDRRQYTTNHSPVQLIICSSAHFSLDIREPITYTVFMNTLPMDKQLTVLNAMIEGNSIRSTERMTGIHRDTIMRLGVRTGEQCWSFLDRTIRGIRAKKVQADEIWTYVFKKQARLAGIDDSELGDQYVFVGMDADTKLVISHWVGKRDAASTYYFMRDMRERVVGRIQLTTDGFKPYRPAVEDTFGGDVDYAQLIKVYGEVPQGMSGRGWYAAAKFVSAYASTVSGVPRPSAVSTSYVERQNLTMRMQMRRFTRLTNAYSKKLENLRASVALHFAHYNFVRIHQSLRITPAMAAGLTGHIWELGELMEAIQ